MTAPLWTCRRHGAKDTPRRPALSRNGSAARPALSRAKRPFLRCDRCDRCDTKGNRTPEGGQAGVTGVTGIRAGPVAVPPVPRRCHTLEPGPSWLSHLSHLSHPELENRCSGMKFRGQFGREIEPAHGLRMLLRYLRSHPGSANRLDPHGHLGIPRTARTQPRWVTETTCPVVTKTTNPRLMASASR